MDRTNSVCSVSLLQCRPNNSIVLKAVASEACKEFGIRTPGAPKRELDRRIDRSFGVQKREGLIQEYKTCELDPCKRSMVCLGEV